MFRPEASLVASTAPTVSRPRDARLDFLRGLALVTIFINHVPGTPYEEWTSRNFGFSDAAEAFFVMSGVAAALAYSRRFSVENMARAGRWQAIAPIWSRAWTLYLVHLLLTAWTIAIVVVGAMSFSEPDLLLRINMRALFADPIGVLTGIPILTHQLGYVNILPVYAVLLLVTPLLIPLAMRSPWRLAVASLSLWFIAGLYRLNFPNYPNPGGWFFNPFAWQGVFVTGLLIGSAMFRGERLVPVRRVWFWSSVGFLLLSLVWRQVPAIGGWFNTLMWQLGQYGLPFHLVGHDKTFLALPRLLHVLALAYVVSTLPFVRRAAGARACAWLRLLGRQGLLVFSLGTLLAIVFQVLLEGMDRPAWLVLGFAPVGIALQLSAAWLAEKASMSGKAARVAGRAGSANDGSSSTLSANNRQPIASSTPVPSHEPALVTVDEPAEVR